MQLANHLQRQIRKQDPIQEQEQREAQATHDNHAHHGYIHVHDSHTSLGDCAHISAAIPDQQALQTPSKHVRQ